MPEIMSIATAEPSIEAVLPKNVLMIILSKLELPDLHKVSRLSRCFRKLAGQDTRVPYGVLYKGKTYMDYTKVLYELDRLVQAAGTDKSVTEATTALMASPRFMRVKSILQAEFGYCIKYVEGRLPEFYLHGVSLDILNDECKIWAVPYVIDRDLDGFGGACLTEGLLDRARLDLVHRLEFSRISSQGFLGLMRIIVPESVLVAAARSLRKNEPASELAGWFSWALLGEQPVPLPESGRIPVFLLPYLLRKNIQIADGQVLVDGLDQSAMSFWGHLVTKTAEEAGEILALVLKHGNDETKLIARAFYEPLSEDDYDSDDRDFYQAVLIRFRFSPLQNAHIISNYESMLAGKLCNGYFAIRASFDCGQYGLDGFSCYDELEDNGIEAIADRMHRLGDDSLNPLIELFISQHEVAETLLKRLIKRKANDSRIQRVWNCLQSDNWDDTDCQYYCSAPVAVLKRLMFDSDLSVKEVRGMLDMFVWSPSYPEHGVSMEVLVLYAVTFWEAPEQVIEHFLDLVPSDCKLDNEIAWSLLRLPKYSRRFCQKLIKRFALSKCWRWDLIAELRPDLVKSLALQADANHISFIAAQRGNMNSIFDL